MQAFAIKFIKQIVINAAAIAVVIAGASIVTAWTGPTAIAPAGNVAAPINVGAIAQEKTGPLALLNGLSVYGASGFLGDLWVNANVRIFGPGKTLVIDEGKGAGKVLTSDANGVASWRTPTGGGGVDPNSPACVTRLINSSYYGGSGMQVCPVNFVTVGIVEQGLNTGAKHWYASMRCCPLN